jgi:chlorophyllide a reductase subunit Y
MSAPPARSTRWSAPTASGWKPRACTSQFRASLEQDSPPWRVQARSRHRHHAGGAEGQGAAIPALYFTNLISARPLMGPAGAGSLAQVVNAAIANKPRFDRMRPSSKASGQGDNAGVWEDTPEDRPAFPQEIRRQGRASIAKMRSIPGR